MTKGKLKETVEGVLRDMPDTRDDDTLLALWVWHRLRPDLFIKVDGRDGAFIRAKDLLDHLPPAEHIGRIRRKYQEAGKYPCTRAEVARKRKQEIDTWKGYARRGVFPST